MTAVRRHIIRRIHRETGRSLREIVRAGRGMSAAQLARQFLSSSTGA